MYLIRSVPLKLIAILFNDTMGDVVLVHSKGFFLKNYHYPSLRSLSKTSFNSLRFSSAREDSYETLQFLLALLMNCTL